VLTLILALMAAPAPPPAEPPPAAPASNTVSALQVPGATGGPDPLVCEYVSPPGSHISTKVCARKSEREEAERASKKLVEDAITRGGGRRLPDR
jgi:hypothetical protein